jgi:hypothetical protein
MRIPARTKAPIITMPQTLSPVDAGVGDGDAVGVGAVVGAGARLGVDVGAGT